MSNPLPVDSVAPVDPSQLAARLGLDAAQVARVMALLDAGEAAPFIARYRRRETGGLGEDAVRRVRASAAELQKFARRKAAIVRSIEAQGRLADELRRAIEAAQSPKRLEDLYLPFGPKSSATAARLPRLEAFAAAVRNRDPALLELFDADEQATAVDRREPGDARPDTADTKVETGTAPDAIPSTLAEPGPPAAPSDLLRTAAQPPLGASGEAEGETEQAGAAAVVGADSPPASAQAHTLEERDSRRREQTHACGTAGDSLGCQSAVEAAHEPDGPTPRLFETTEPPPPGHLVADGHADQPDRREPQDLGEHGPIAVADAPACAVNEEAAQACSEGAAADIPRAPRANNAPVSRAHRVLEKAAETFVSPAEGLHAAADVVEGVVRLLAEQISEDAEARSAARRVVWKTGKLRSAPCEHRGRAEGSGSSRKTAKPAPQEFRPYLDYREDLARVPPYRMLAVARGERQRVLGVRVEVDQEAARTAVLRRLGLADHPFAPVFADAVARSLTLRILPDLEREARRELAEAAEAFALEIACKNLRRLLLTPPVPGRVLVVDPLLRGGCQLVALDEHGNLLDQALVPTRGSAEKRAAARARLEEMVDQHRPDRLAIGAGTGCRDAETLVAAVIAARAPDLRYTVVNAVGAMQYAASPTAREELPDQSTAVRAAVSVGRRLQDPLRELVKIEPRALVIGIHPDDVPRALLEDAQEATVASCVNFVGADLNTAGVPLLRYVAGLNHLTARRLVDWRAEHGPFRCREELKHVPGIGAAAFVQAAGFLTIAGGTNPLDATRLHPSEYEVAARLLEAAGAAPADLADAARHDDLRRKLAELNVTELAPSLGLEAPVIEDLVAELARPGRDPRLDLPAPLFYDGTRKLADLTPGMELAATVVSAVDFGVFVDIGSGVSGLVHISQLAPRRVSSPYDVIALGDVVTVWVLSADAERRRISLTMIPPGAARTAGARRSQGAARRARSEAANVAVAPSPRPSSPRRGRAAPAAADEEAAQQPSVGPAPTVPPAVSDAAASESRSSRHADSSGARRPFRGGQRRGGSRLQPAGDAHAVRKSRRPPPPKEPLPPEVLDGSAPVRTFGDLKRLWDETRGG